MDEVRVLKNDLHPAGFPGENRPRHVAYARDKVLWVVGHGANVLHLRAVYKNPQNREPYRFVKFLFSHGTAEK